MKVLIHRPEEGVDCIEIESHDLWSLDYTLARIISPALKMLKEEQYGYPMVDQEDTPPELHEHPSVADHPWQEGHEYSEARWNWVLDEMIWAFDYILEDNALDLPNDVAEINSKRTKNALFLFGKYFQALWN